MSRERVHLKDLDTKHSIIYWCEYRTKNINVLRIGSVCELLVDLVSCVLRHVGRES